MKVLIPEVLSEEGIKILKEEGIEVDEKIGISPEELRECIDQYHAIIIRSNTKVDAELIERAEKMIVVGRAGVGVDNIDINAATKKGIIVLNSPEGNTIATAEHTMAMILSLARNIPQANQMLKKGKWERNKFVGVELFRKTLGIIGLGRIGTEVAKRAQGFEMKIKAYDPFLSPERAQSIGVEAVDIETVIRESDFITVHAQLTKKTAHIIGKEQFNMMKDGVRIVNCARGGIIDEQALKDALKEGKVAGVALDVYEQEPAVENPLIGLDNVVSVPHLGASTREAQINVAVDVVEQVCKALRGEPVSNAVNLPFLRPEVLAPIKQYLGLAEKLGIFEGQRIKGYIQSVEISYSGDLADKDVSALTASFLKGLLGKVVDEEVNLVNATVYAESRGIEITQKKTGVSKDFANLIKASVKTEYGIRTVSGTLIGKTDPRIVQIDRYWVDAIPEGYFLLVTYIDKPGMIGKVGTILGKSGINIATMQVGRESAGGEAVMVLGIDSQANQEDIEDISKVEGISGVDMVNF